jgi:hypothetical protein
MGETHLKNSPPAVVIAPVFWAWAQQQAAPEEPLHLTRQRAIQLQLQADADLRKPFTAKRFLRWLVCHAHKVGHFSANLKLGHAAKILVLRNRYADVPG